MVLRPHTDGRPVLTILERLRPTGGTWIYAKKPPVIFADEWDAVIEAIVRAQEAVAEADEAETDPTMEAA